MARPAPGSRRPRRRTAIRPEIERLEDRLTPSVSFNPTTGVLFLQADSPASNHHVTIPAAAVVAGSGADSVQVGDATRDFPFQGRSLYVGIGYGYGFDPAGGSFVGGSLGGGAGAASNANSNFVKIDDSTASGSWADINGT